MLAALAALAACVLVGSRLPWIGKVGTVAEGVVVVVVGLVVLIATGEVGGADLARVKAVLRRKKG